MNLPILPTDNLYKFIALSGLTIIFTSLFFMGSTLIELDSEIINLNTEIKMVEHEVKLSQSYQRSLHEKIKGIKLSSSDSININTDSIAIDRFNKISEKLYEDKNLREYYEFVFKYENKFIPYNLKLEKLKNENDRISNLNNEIMKKFVIIGGKEALLKSKNKWFKIFSFTFPLITFIGILLTMFGFRKWNECIQKPTDEKILIELQNLKKTVEK